MPLVESSLRRRVSKRAIKAIVQDINLTNKNTEREKVVAYTIWEILNGVYDPLDTNDRIRAYGVMWEILADYSMLVGQPKELQALVARFHEAASE
jgi:hypothetical protein